MEDIDQKVSTLKDEGNQYFAKGNAKQAIECYSKGLELSPDSHILYSNRAAAHLKLSQFQEALDDALKCTTLAPTWAKGYTRLAQAQLRTGKFDDAEKTIQILEKIDPNDRNIVSIRDSIKCKRIFKKLKGNWHGKVSPDLGGYVQIFDIVSETQAHVSVFGRSIPARVELSLLKEPAWLDLHVESEPGQPAPPCVKHIFKFEDDNTLVLCSPYMTSPDERPTKFEGPACVVMKRGLPESDKAAEDLKRKITSMSPSEKCEKFAQEVIELLPDHRIAPTAEDSDEIQSQIILENVKFQTAYFEVKEKYGDDTENFTRMYLEGAVKCPSDSLAKLIDVLRKKMQVCGMYPTDEELNAAMGITPESNGMLPTVAEASSSDARSAEKPSFISQLASSEPKTPAGASSPSNSANTCLMIAGVVALTSAVIAAIYMQKSK